MDRPGSAFDGNTEPQAFGKVMSEVKPRLAVGYHSVQSLENNAAIMDGVRKIYDGPLALARDLMVINVTKETIKVRMASVDEYVLLSDVTQAYKDAPRSDEKSPSKLILNGKWKGYTPPCVALPPTFDRHGWRECKRIVGTILAM